MAETNIPTLLAISIAMWIRWYGAALPRTIPVLVIICSFILKLYPANSPAFGAQAPAGTEALCGTTAPKLGDHYSTHQGNYFVRTLAGRIAA